MWSIGAAVLLWIALCSGAVILAALRFRTECKAQRSFDLLHREVVLAVGNVSRDTGRAAASRQLLMRHGRAPAPR